MALTLKETAELDLRKRQFAARTTPEGKAAKAYLLDRGLDSATISLKAFYRVGRANGANGEPEKEP